MITIHPNEKILLEVRKHWYILLAESFFLLLLAFLPIIVLGILSSSGDLMGNQKVMSLYTFLTAAWFLVLWVFFFIIWTNYYLDVWIVTSERVIDVEQHYLFSREVSEFKVEKIQDITVEVHGFIPTLLRFGDIKVQTAGDARFFTIRHIPRPERVKELLFKRYDEITGGRPAAKP